MASLSRGSPNADTQDASVPGACSNSCAHRVPRRDQLDLGFSLTALVLLEGWVEAHSSVLPQGLVQFKLQKVNDYTEL